MPKESLDEVRRWRCSNELAFSGRISVSLSLCGCGLLALFLTRLFTFGDEGGEKWLFVVAAARVRGLRIVDGGVEAPSLCCDAKDNADGLGVLTLRLRLLLLLL